MRLSLEKSKQRLLIQKKAQQTLDICEQILLDEPSAIILKERATFIKDSILNGIFPTTLLQQAYEDLNTEFNIDKPSTQLSPSSH